MLATYWELGDERNKNAPCMHAPIDPRSFIECVVSKYPPMSNEIEIPSAHFMRPWRFKGLLKKSPERAPSRKASGTDATFTEAMQVCSTLTIDYMMAHWTRCWTVGFEVRQCHEVLLALLYKKGDHQEAPYYRPNALVSHARELIKCSIFQDPKKMATFHCHKCGFRPGLF